MTNMKSNLINRNKVLAGLLVCGLGMGVVSANDRRFTYSYEPETMPKGAMEFEQWITLRTQRTKEGSVQQENFNEWEIRESLEYGVTDRYTVELYLNAKAESYRDVSVSPAADVSTFDFDGISIENRYMVLNPANNPVGLTLYFEPRFSGSELELEEKIIIGQRYGNWKWAVNLTHATEWVDNWDKTEGELEASLGVAYDFNANWSLGLDLAILFKTVALVWTDRRAF